MNLIERMHEVADRALIPTVVIPRHLRDRIAGAGPNETVVPFRLRQLMTSESQFLSASVDPVARTDLGSFGFLLDPLAVEELRELRGRAIGAAQEVHRLTQYARDHGGLTPQQGAELEVWEQRLDGWLELMVICAQANLGSLIEGLAIDVGRRFEITDQEGSAATTSAEFLRAMTTGAGSTNPVYCTCGRAGTMLIFMGIFDLLTAMYGPEVAVAWLTANFRLGTGHEVLTDGVTQVYFREVFDRVPRGIPWRIVTQSDLNVGTFLFRGEEGLYADDSRFGPNFYNTQSAVVVGLDGGRWMVWLPGQGGLTTLADYMGGYPTSIPITDDAAGGETQTPFAVQVNVAELIRQAEATSRQVHGR